MTISKGTRLGPYEIVDSLGAGGMGEVWRAKDTRLDRDVAIKILPPGFAESEQLLQRFEREARAISSLNHPHICTLYDVGQTGLENRDTGLSQDSSPEHPASSLHYLVMELIEGDSLADRLKKGPLPVHEVLKYGHQIASALDAAHRQGITHRDLKPGNIMLTRSGAKLLDFGLAKTTAAGVVDGLTNLPTEARPLTQEGTILGTFQYMAPEQLEGLEADARTDIFALGAVLYEMATGRRAFQGESKTSLIAAIVSSQPEPISSTTAMTPPALDHVVRKCLEKDPDDRWQSAHDVATELKWISEAGSQAGVATTVTIRRRTRERLAWTFAMVALVAAAVLAWQVLDARDSEPEAIQTIIEAPPDARLGERHAAIAIAPDGRTVAFVASNALWIRPLGSDAAIRLAGTEGAFRPFWSPDSRTIAYFSPGKLMRIPATGGSPTSICDASTGRGGSWGPDDTIVFAPNLGGPLVRVSAAGGDPVAVTALDSTRHESAHRFPFFLPDGEHFLFATLPGSPDGWDTWVGSLRSGTVKRLLTARSVAIYAEPGYLLFERDGRVLVQSFDPARLELQGAPVSIADAPEPSDLDAEPVASASRNGRLAILRSEPADTLLEMRDPTGATITRLDLPEAPWKVSSATPDGRRAAVLKGDELWVVDLARSVPMRLATNLASDPTTVWSPDGNRIAYVAKHDEREEIYIGGLDGRADLVPTTGDPFKGVTDWSRDGRYLVFWSQNAETGVDLWTLPMDGDRKPVPYLLEPATETSGRISPDGRWLAYMSNETGENEIYVQSFPEPGRKVRISVDGGVGPRWRDDGRQLRYVNLARREFVAVPVKGGEEFEPGPPTKVGDLDPEVTSGVGLGDDRGALVSVATDRRPRDIRLILDWTALLER